MKKKFACTSKFVYIILLTTKLLLNPTHSIILVDKPYENLKMMNGFSNMVQDRNLMQCLMDKQFKNSQNACPTKAHKTKRARQLTEVLAKASQCQACRRTQYREEYAVCKEQIRELFQSFLYFQSDTVAEKQAMMDLVKKFMNYVLILKDYKEELQTQIDPNKNISDFISDEVYGLQHDGAQELSEKEKKLPVIGKGLKGSSMFGHTVDFPIDVSKNQQNSNSGTFLTTNKKPLSFNDENRVEKANLQIKSRAFIKKADNFIEKFEDQPHHIREGDFDFHPAHDPKKVKKYLKLCFLI